MVNQFTDPSKLRNERLQVNMTISELARVRQTATATGRTMAGLVRSALRVYCDEVERTEFRLSPHANLHTKTDESR